MDSTLLVIEVGFEPTSLKYANIDIAEDRRRNWDNNKTGNRYRVGITDPGRLTPITDELFEPPMSNKDNDLDLVVISDMEQESQSSNLE